MRHDKQEAVAHQVVALSDIRSCEYFTKREIAGSSGKSYEVITQVGIVLQPHKSSEGILLEFYNRSEREQLGNEQALAQQWAALIKSHLKV
ncbi:hypothetical protein [Rhodoflexus sp.]